jgi:DNA-binding CsgD family transcriptional regulator
MFLAERADQLNQLSLLFRRASCGEGQVILLTGPIASGKTTLVGAFCEQVTTVKGQVIRAAGARAERSHEFGIVRQLLQCPALPAELAERATEFLADPAPDGAVHLFGEDGHVHEQVLREVFGMLVGLAGATPVAVVIDDVDHADAASLECIIYTARRLGSARLAVVLTEVSPHLDAAHSEARSELLRLPFCTQVQVSPLSVEGVAQLLDASGQGGASSLARQYFQITGGNPLLVRACIADNSADNGDAVGRPGGPAALRIGDEFRAAVGECLYRHGGVVRKVAQGLAICAESVKAALASELLAIPEKTTAQAIRQLAASGLLDSGSFRHPSIRAVLVEDLGADDARRLHARAAELLYRDGASPDLVAGHLVKVGCASEPWAKPTLRAAAERALLANEPQVASDYLRLADEVETDPRERAATGVQLVRARWQFNPLSAVRYLGELAEAARGNLLSLPDMLTIVPYSLWDGRSDEAADVVGLALKSRGELDVNGFAQLRATTMLASWSPASEWIALDGEEAERREDPGLLSASAHPVLQAVAVLGTALTRPGDVGIAGAEQILQRCELEDAAFGRVAAALGALICAGRSDRAIIWCEAFLHRPSLRKAPTWHAIMRALRAEAALRVGDLTGAENHGRIALAAMRTQDWGIGIGLPLAVVLLAATETGNFKEASGALAVSVPAAMSHTPVGLLYLRARGRYHLATGRFQAAMSDFRSCAEVMDRQGFGHPRLVPWRLEMARAHLCLGEANAAAALVREELDSTDGMDNRTQGLALRLRAAATVPPQRIALLKRAVDTLQDCDDRVELAHALADLGRAMDAQGDAGRARMMMTRAFRLASDCGAQLLCGKLLRDKPGINGPESPLSADADGVSLLSDAERRVASLAAQGCTNREIARKLFITVSTVEQHLTRAYKKLDIKRRIDLPVALVECADPWERQPADARTRMPDPLGEPHWPVSFYRPAANPRPA